MEELDEDLFACGFVNKEFSAMVSIEVMSYVNVKFIKTALKFLSPVRKINGVNLYSKKQLYLFIRKYKSK